MEANLEPLRLVEERLRVDLRRHVAHDGSHQERPGHVERVEVGIELGGRELHLRERLAGQRE
jgi:hypothetical protein